jgi:hypothetical protein
VSVTVWDFNACRNAAKNADLAQRDGEAAYQEANEVYARAEAAYRVELAKETLKLRADGMAATLVPDLAKGNERISSLRLERDIAKGLLDAANHAMWRHNATRRDVQRFVDYSLAINTGRAMD